MRKVTIGIIGFGTIGAGVASILLREKKLLQNRTGIQFVLKRIADLDIRSNRGITVPKGMLTKDSAAVIADSEIDIIVELIGGKTTAKKIVLHALAAGKSVVTANKALLAEKGSELFAAAKKAGCFIRYEASVAGGIPIIKSVSEALVANRFTRIVGILNGTCNYILWNMTKNNWDYNTALSRAQQLGFAESDPTLDVNGSDAAHKIALLAGLAFNTYIPFGTVYREGIHAIQQIDIAYGKKLGYELKLLAIAHAGKKGIECRVHPTFICAHHALANVANEYNAIYLEGDKVGAQMMIGKGAGSLPTAGAVVADIVDIAKELQRTNNASYTVQTVPLLKSVILPPDRFCSRYYFRIMTLDKPGVLARIAGLLGKYNISIASVIQKEIKQATVPIVIITHAAEERNVQKAITAINALSEVRRAPVIYRIEDISNLY